MIIKAYICMNNSYIMSESLEARQKRIRAAMITAGVAAALAVLMIIIKWDTPKIEKVFVPVEVEIALNLPEPPPVPEQALGGGGGGGNPVQAPGPAGQAPPTPPDNGDADESDDADVSDNNNTPIPKASNPKPNVKQIAETGPKKEDVKPVVTPSPPRPKAVMGNNNHGTERGGNEATTYERNGGTRGGGNGVGNGPGNGGGTGGGTGGGNGTGVGTGTGPRRVSGSRYVINPKPMNVEDDLKGRIVAEIKVSPDGVGTFVKSKGGSLMNNTTAKEIVRDWLKRNRFDKKAEEGIVEYEFVINY